MFAGKPARDGVTAALLVKSGWNGVDDIFSGPDNFFAAYAPKAQPDEELDLTKGTADGDGSPGKSKDEEQAPLDATRA